MRNYYWVVGGATTGRSWSSWRGVASLVGSHDLALCAHVVPWNYDNLRGISEFFSLRMTKVRMMWYELWEDEISIMVLWGEMMSWFLPAWHDYSHSSTATTPDTRRIERFQKSALLNLTWLDLFHLPPNPHCTLPTKCIPISWSKQHHHHRLDLLPRWWWSPVLLWSMLHTSSNARPKRNNLFDSVKNNHGLFLLSTFLWCS